MDIALQNNHEDQSSNPQDLWKTQAGMAASMSPGLGKQRQIARVSWLSMTGLMCVLWVQL